MSEPDWVSNRDHPMMTGAQKARELVTLFANGQKMEMMSVANGMSLEEARVASEYLAPFVVGLLWRMLGVEGTKRYLQKVLVEMAVNDEVDLERFNFTVDLLMKRHGEEE